MSLQGSQYVFPAESQSASGNQKEELFDLVEISYTLKNKTMHYVVTEKVTRKMCQQNKLNFDKILNNLQQKVRKDPSQKSENLEHSQISNEGFLMGLLLERQFLQGQVKFLELEEEHLLSEMISLGKQQKDSKKQNIRNSLDEKHSTEGSDSPKQHFQEFIIAGKGVSLMPDEIHFVTTPIEIQKKWFYYNDVAGNLITCKRTEHSLKEEILPQRAYYQLVSQERVPMDCKHSFAFKILKSYNGSIILGLTHQCVREKRKSFDSGWALGYEGARGRVYGQGNGKGFVQMGKGFQEGSLVTIVVSPEGKHKTKVEWYVNGKKEATVLRKLLDKNYYPYIETCFEGDQVEYYSGLH